MISTRKVQTDDGTLFLDMKCGNLMQQRITRIQTEQANEIARLIKQYITIDQRMKGVIQPTQPTVSMISVTTIVYLSHTKLREID